MAKKLKRTSWYLAIFGGLMAVPIVLFANLLQKLLIKLQDGMLLLPASYDLLRHNYVEIIIMLIVTIIVAGVWFKVRETEYQEIDTDEKIIELLEGINVKLDLLSSKIETKGKKNKEDEANNNGGH